jgi:hypothetical protein
MNSKDKTQTTDTGLKVRTSTSAGGLTANHNPSMARGLSVRTNVQAAGFTTNHTEDSDYMKDQDTRSIGKTTSTATCSPLFLVRRALKLAGLTAAVIGALQCATSGLSAPMFALSQDGTGFSTLNSISTSGTVSPLFGVGYRFTGLTWVEPDLGYGSNLLYSFANDNNGFSTLTTISTSGAVLPRFGVGYSFKALAFAAADLGYGPNLLYGISTDAGGFCTLNTISTRGAIVPRFGLGYRFDSLTFVSANLGYGPNLFYAIANDTTGFSTLYTIATSGAVVARFGLGYGFKGLACAEEDLGYGPNLFYSISPGAGGISVLTTISLSGSVVQRFGVGFGFTDLAQMLAKPTTGTWTPLANSAPGAVNLMLLLSDGTVMAQNGGGTDWYQLTPDSHGSYVKGTWTTLAPMHDTRLWYSSDVLRDGRVFVAGAEYGTGKSTAEVYDPLRNAWTVAPPSGQTFVDSVSKVLPDGNVLVAPVWPSTGGGTVIYNPTLNTWSSAGNLCRGWNQDEASWVKLPDESILTVDPFGTDSERYIPSLNQWISDAALPVALYNNLGEMGAGLLLPDGRAFFLGGTGHTALYTPSGNLNQGAWAAGPDIPGGLGTSDAPAAMMANGKILCAVGDATSYAAPTSFYEYDPVDNAFEAVNGPTGETDNVPPFDSKMLDLPDGSVLYSHFSGDLYVYQPGGSPLAAGKPAISSIVRNTDGSYHLAGTGLNGISEGAAYGDDAQMDSNRPLVRLTDAAGHVYYARTYNWSSTGVMTGNKPVTTEFALPAGLPAGAYSLVAVANGISSDPVSLTVHKARGH